VPTMLLRMTHQDHSATTFTCGFTHLGGNDSGNSRAVAVYPVMHATSVTPASLLEEVVNRNIARSSTEGYIPGQGAVLVAQTVLKDRSHARIRPVRPALSRHTTEGAVPPDHLSDPVSARAADLRTSIPPFRQT
jgi:hypothetical protein